MNINKLMDRIKKRIGLNGILKDIYSDKVLYDSIINVSLNTLNNLHGFTLRGQLDSFMSTWGLNIGAPDARNNNDPAAYGVLTYNDAIMNVPKELMDQLKMTGSEIRKVYINDAKRPVYMTPYANDIRDELMSLNRAQKYKRNYSKPQIQFKAPGTIIMKDYVSSGRYYRLAGYELFIQCTHPRNLSTITRGIADFFESLCMYDIMINIFNNELAMLNVDLGNSRVEVNLEQFTSAAGNRDTLIENFKNRAANDEILIF